MNTTIDTTEQKQVVDITERVQEAVSDAGVEQGSAYVFVHHTTCALTTADLDPGTDQDYLDAIEAMFPDLEYRHPHDPEHVGDHIMSSLIGADVTVPIHNGKVQLGTWQHIVLLELNGPRERNVTMHTYKSDD